jgi:hypothetical protein
MARRSSTIIRLANQDQDAVLRVDADIKVYPPAASAGLLLAAALAQQPRRGAVDWERGAELCSEKRARLMVTCLVVHPVTLSRSWQLALTTGAGSRGKSRTAARAARSSACCASTSLQDVIGTIDAMWNEVDGAGRLTRWWQRGGRA